MSKQRRQNGEYVSKQFDEQAIFDWDCLHEQFQKKDFEEEAVVEKQLEKKTQLRHVTCKMIMKAFVKRLERQRARTFLRRIKQKVSKSESYMSIGVLRAGGPADEETRLVPHEGDPPLKKQKIQYQLGFFFGSQPKVPALQLKAQIELEKAMKEEEQASACLQIVAEDQSFENLELGKATC